MSAEKPRQPGNFSSATQIGFVSSPAGSGVSCIILSWKDIYVNLALPQIGFVFSNRDLSNAVIQDSVFRVSGQSPADWLCFFKKATTDSTDFIESKRRQSNNH